jgi:uncharacterized membrane protein YkvA (DUF1232 family)
VSTCQWILVTLVATLVLYALGVAALYAMGRRSAARGLAGFIPDLLILVRGLLRDPRVPRSRKFLLGALALYLALPLDIVPDFIPVAGALDDVLLVAWVLRSLVKGAGRDVVEDNWRGPPESLALVFRAAGIR